MQALAAVNVVRAVEKAKQRIKIESKQTFYSHNDLWYYFTVPVDDRVCSHCLSYDNRILFGSALRSEFPYHDITDENIIEPKVHPNCRCLLIRTVNPLVEPEEIAYEE